jgi:hypothetical protein
MHPEKTKARFKATPYGTLPVIDPVHTERAIQAALEGGQVHGWEALAELAGATPEDVMWTCERLQDCNRFTVLTREFILDAFEFAERHNPKELGL